MNFFQRYEELAKLNGSSVNAIAKELGLSSGSVTAWKNGTDPSIKAIEKIAERFNVSIDYLLGKTDNLTPSSDKGEPAPEAGSFEWLRQGLIARGIIKEGKDLTDKQLLALLRNLDMLGDSFCNPVQE